MCACWVCVAISKAEELARTDDPSIYLRPSVMRTFSTVSLHRLRVLVGAEKSGCAGRQWTNRVQLVGHVMAEIVFMSFYSLSGINKSMEMVRCSFRRTMDRRQNL